MSNSVHRQWLKPLLRAALSSDPSVVPPAFSPLQVTEVSLPAPGASNPVPSDPSSGARLLLSDKAVSVWCVVSAGALARFQALFPEFQPSAQKDAHALARLCGGIVLPTRCNVQVHPNLSECMLHIDGLEYKGGAGNNEFGRPIYHTEDKEIQQLLLQYRNIDLTPLLDRALTEAPPAAPAAAAAAAATFIPGSDLPFVASVRAQIEAHARDARNAHLDVDAIVSAEQQEQLNAIDEGFHTKKGRASAAAAAAAAAGGSGAAAAANDADASAFLLSPATFSQLDSFQADQAAAAAAAAAGPDTQGYFSQEIHDVPQAHFSQREGVAAAAAGVPAAPRAKLATVLEGDAASCSFAVAAQSSAAASAAASSAAAAPSASLGVTAQSATQRFLQRRLRAEGFDEDMPSHNHRPAAAGQQQRTVVVTPPFVAPTTATAAAAAALPVAPPSSASRASPPPPSPPRSQAASPSKPHPSSQSASLPPPSPSPARTSLSLDISGGTGGQNASPARAQPPSQESLHNLPIDDDNMLLPPSNEAAANDYGARGATHQPPHTQAPHLMDDDDDEDADGAAAEADAAVADEVDEEEAAAYAEQEARFPFLTQAPQASEDQDEDEEEDEDGEGDNQHEQQSTPPKQQPPILPPMQRGSAPMELDDSLTPASAGREGRGRRCSKTLSQQTASPSSLRIPPTPTPVSSTRSSAANSAKGSPQPTSSKAATSAPPSSIAAVAASDYSADAIARRQAARERQVAEALEAEERVRAAEAERERKRKEAEAAAALAAEEERIRIAVQGALEEERMRVAAERAAAEEAARAAEAAAAAATASAAAAAATDSLSDEEAYQLAANLRDSPARKRSFEQMAAPTTRGPGRPPAGAGAGAGSAAPSPAAKKARLPLNRQGAVPVAPTPGGRQEQQLPVFIEDSLRRAVEAMERAEQRAGGAGSRQRAIKFPVLQLSTISSSRATRATATPGTMGSAAAAAAAAPAAPSPAGMSPAAPEPPAAEADDDDDMPPLDAPGGSVTASPAAAKRTAKAATPVTTASPRVARVTSVTKPGDRVTATGDAASVIDLASTPPAAAAPAVSAPAAGAAVNVANDAAATPAAVAAASFGVSAIHVSKAQVRSAIQAFRAAKAKQQQQQQQQTTATTDAAEEAPPASRPAAVTRKPSAASRAAAAISPAASAAAHLFAKRSPARAAAAVDNEDEGEQKSSQDATAAARGGRAAPRSNPAAPRKRY